MDSVRSPIDLVLNDAPDRPVFCFRPARLEAAARWFRDVFPARPFYAVKANPSAHVLDTLWKAGIDAFDVASDGEAERVAQRFASAELAFMHPIKNRRAIARAYHEFGCRRFVLDTQGELDKILEATGQARDLTLLVRVGVSNQGATLPLTGKFGAREQDAPALLRAARAVSAELGVSFHVGSQALSPPAWHTAMADLSRLIVAAGVTVDIVDVGGGFPGHYGGLAPPALGDYAGVIAAAFDDMKVLENAALWCEPGRALVAESESLLVRIEGTHDGSLYLNDGGFGALYDVVHERWHFPVRALGASGRIGGAMREWTVYGPTCDSADRFPEKLALPASLGEGDYLEFGNIGAYGRAMAGRFNGFGEYETVMTRDAPWPSLYDGDPLAAAPDTVTALTRG
ncbi:MAG: type III PLP-dependent enzyme [Alphaproteobacteria bacterium]|jgi:ornithine decarboxylase|nr:type III PLP-dependent enzyme [Alphaproteobacteria bacterium]